jgi:hypothetical protein
MMAVTLSCLGLSQQAQAVSATSCGVAKEFIPVLTRGSSYTYSDGIYAIGANSAHLMPKCGPISTTRNKSALLLVPPVPEPVVEPKVVAAAQMDMTTPEVQSPPPAPIAVVKPAPRPTALAASEVSADPVPVTKPDAVQAQLPAQVPSEAESYSEPSMVAPVVIGLGTAAVLSYALWNTFNDKDGEPARLTTSSEPVRALAAYDTNMLASYAALNTVADLQSDQRIAVGVSSSVYDETAALAAGMSFRLGAQGIFKTAISYSDNEYLANAGLSYGW